MPAVPTRDRRQFQKAGSQPAPVQDDPPEVAASTPPAEPAEQSDDLPEPLDTVESTPLPKTYSRPVVPAVSEAPRLSDDPNERAQQSMASAESDFAAKQRAVNPFIYSGAVKSLAKTGGKKYMEKAVREGERDYSTQVQNDRAQAIAARRGEQDRIKAENATREEQFRSTGQQFYTDPYGRIQPIQDPEGRALYHATPWEEGTHPKTGAPVLQKRDQFGQRQFKTPPIVASPDLTDDQLYYKFGDDDLRPAGKIEDLVNHPDFTIARTAKRAATQRKKAIWAEAIAPMEAVKADTETAFDQGQQRAIDLQGQIEQLTSQSSSILPEVLNQTEGGVLGIGSKPTALAQQAQQQKTAIDAQLSSLMAEQAQLHDSLKPMGQLGRTKRTAALDLAMFKAKAAHESYGDLADERRLILKQQGKSEADDPTLKSILEAQDAYGTQLQRAASMSEREALANSQASRAAAVVPGAPKEEPFVAARNGVRSIGGVGIDEFAKRYGDGRNVQPDQLMRLAKRSTDISSTLTSNAQLDSKILNSLTEEKNYVDALFQQRLAKLAPEQQQAVQEATRDSTIWDTIKGVVKSGAGAAARGGSEALKGFETLADSLPTPTSDEFGVRDPTAQRVAAARANRTPSQKLEDIKSGPAYQLGSFVEQSAHEFYQKSPHEDEGRVSQALNAAAEAAGGFAPLIASGPAAPLTIGLQTAGADLESNYQRMIERGSSPDEAADFAVKRALANGALQSVLFELLPKPLQKAGNKLIVDKIAGGALSKFLANRLAQGTEGAIMGGVSSAAGNVASGRPVAEGVPESMTGLALAQAAMPRSGPVRPEDRPAAPAAERPAAPPPTESAAPSAEPVKSKRPQDMTPDEAEAEFQRRINESDLSPEEKTHVEQLRKESEPFTPNGPPSTAAEAARVLEPALAEEANRPPPAKSAEESARAIQEAESNTAHEKQIESTKEARLQQLLDDVTKGDDKLRARLLALREKHGTDKFKEAMERMVDYRRNPASQPETVAEDVTREVNRVQNAPLSSETPGVENVGRIRPAELDAIGDVATGVAAERAAAGHAGVTADELSARRAGQEMMGRRTPDASEAEPINFDEAPSAAAGKDRIAKAAVRFSDGEVRTGKNHAEIVDALGGRDLRGSEDGFVTDSGRYVTREEAMKIARENGQTSGQQTGLTVERLKYDELQSQMKALGPEKFGTPEYQDLWRQAEEIKNRNKGMPPGEVAGESQPKPEETQNATPTGKQPSDGEQQHPRALQGSAVQENVGEVRPQESAEAGGGNRPVESTGQPARGRRAGSVRAEGNEARDAGAQGERDAGAQGQETVRPEVGKIVRYKVAGPSGDMTVAGTVKSVYPNGRLEVRRQQGGYDIIDPGDVIPRGEKSKPTEPGLVARTEPKPRADIENGTRYTEWRTRKITNEDLNNGTIARQAGKDDFLLERRSVKTEGSKVEPGEWEPMGTGTTKRAAIEDGWESGMEKATSFDEAHRKLADESAARVKELQDAEANKKENYEKSRVLHAEYIRAVEAVPLKGKNGDVKLSWTKDGEPVEKTVPGTIYGDWAIYKSQQGRDNVYNVVHVESGKRAIFVNTAGEAKRIIQAIIESGADASKIMTDAAEKAKVAQAIMGVRSEETPKWFKAPSSEPPAKAPAPVSAHIEEHTPETVEGDKINGKWTAFAPDSGTLGVPREEMPQIKSEARGALVNFMKARGIDAKAGMINPSKLKPTQAEFSPEKVQAAREHTGSERPILISSDNHVVDGHHQWVAALDDTSTPMPVIKLNAPIDRVLAEMKEFPSSEQAKGVGTAEPTKAKAAVVSAAPSLSQRAIDALQKAKIRKPGELHAVAEPFSIAYDAALDIAILGIRAGRALADVIKLAVARFKAKHPAATADDVAKLTKAITDAHANQPEPPAPKSAKSAVPESLRGVDVPAKDIEYDVRNQDALMKEARVAVDKNPTEAEANISNRALPADSRVALGGILLEKKMQELGDATKPEDISRITSEINRITSAVRSGVSTESGQGVAMHNRIYKNLGVMSAMEYARDVNGKRLEALGGDEAGKAAQEVADVFNKTKDQAARDREIEKMKARFTSKPVRRMLNSLQGLEVAQKLNELGVLRRDDLVDMAANQLGLPGIDGTKLRHIADLVDNIENAKNLAEAEKHQLELADTLANFKGTSKIDLETSLMTLNVLLSANTQIANAGGNAVRLMTELSSVAGTNPKQAMDMWKGFKDGLPLGWSQAKSIWETGRSTRDLQDKTIGVGSAVERADYKDLYPSLNKNPIGRGVAVALNTRKDVLAHVGRFMRAMDALAYYPAREAYARMSVAQQLLKGGLTGDALQQRTSEILHTTPEQLASAKEQAKKEGYTGISLDRRASEIVEARRGLTPEGESAAKQAESFAADTTYTNEPVGNAGIVYRAASNVANKVRIGGVPVLRPWMMFLRTPTNMFNASLDYTPVGAARAFKGSMVDQKGIPKDLTGDEINRKYFQASVGTSLMAGTTLAIAKGLMDVTFKGPQDPEKRKQLQAAGWRPFSYKIGNGPYVSYRDTPMIVPLAVVGYVADAYKYNHDTKSQFLENRVADALVNAPYEAAFATSPLTGMADLLGAANGGGNLSRTLTSVPTNLAIPGARLLMELDRTLDPKVYDSNPIKQTIPFLRREGTTRSDVQGRDVNVVPSDRFFGVSSKDPVDKLLIEKDVFIPGVSDSLKTGNRVFTPEETEAYKRVSGQRIRARLQSEAPRIRTLTKEKAQDEVDRISREERARIKPLIGVTIKK